MMSILTVFMQLVIILLPAFMVLVVCKEKFSVKFLLMLSSVFLNVLFSSYMNQAFYIFTKSVSIIDEKALLWLFALLYDLLFALYVIFYTVYWKKR